MILFTILRHLDSALIVILNDVVFGVVKVFELLYFEAHSFLDKYQDETHTKNVQRGVKPEGAMEVKWGVNLVLKTEGHRNTAELDCHQCDTPSLFLTCFCEVSECDVTCRYLKE